MTGAITQSRAADQTSNTEYIGMVSAFPDLTDAGVVGFAKPIET
jgi:hypothetical protein